MKIIPNPDEEFYEKITAAVRDNDGYCPCKLEKTDDTLCPCAEFRVSKKPGECHCGRFIKVDIKER